MGTPSEDDTYNLEAKRPKAENMPKQMYLKPTTHNNSILKYAYTPRKISKKNQRKVIKVNIDRSDIRNKINQRHKLKCKVLDVLTVRPFLRPGLCENVASQKEIHEASEDTMNSWKRQIAAIDSLKYHDQNIGPNGLENLRDTNEHDTWHPLAGTSTSNLIKTLVEKKHILEQEMQDAAVILNTTPEDIETKMSEQLSKDVENERLLAITNESTLTLDTLRERINVSKSNYIRAEKLAKEGNDKRTKSKLVQDKEKWSKHSQTGELVPLVEFSDSEPEDDKTEDDSEMETPTTEPSNEEIERERQLANAVDSLQLRPQVASPGSAEAPIVNIKSEVLEEHNRIHADGYNPSVATGTISPTDPNYVNPNPSYLPTNIIPPSESSQNTLPNENTITYPIDPVAYAIKKEILENDDPDLTTTSYYANSNEYDVDKAIREAEQREAEVQMQAEERAGLIIPQQIPSRTNRSISGNSTNSQTATSSTMSYPENAPTDTDETMEVVDPSNPQIQAVEAVEEDESEQNSESNS